MVYSLRSSAFHDIHLLSRRIAPRGPISQIHAVACRISFTAALQKVPQSLYQRSLVSISKLVDQRNTEGKTPLQITVEKISKEEDSLPLLHSIECLLDVGANPNVHDKDGKTPPIDIACGSSADCQQLIHLLNRHSTKSMEIKPPQNNLSLQEQFLRNINGC